MKAKVTTKGVLIARDKYKYIIRERKL